MNNKKLSISKPIVSISEICQMLQLSRSRYYQLINSGFFPKPLHDERSNRSYYDIALQKKILECRQSGIGSDGSYLLFYSSRKSANVSDLRRKKIDPQVKEIVETLQTMGLEVTVKQVQQGLLEIYPDGIGEIDQGVVVRDIFRYFKSQ